MRSLIEAVAALIKDMDAHMIFGFGILGTLTTLAVMIALGHVHQEASYGLEIILGALSTLSGAFAQYAFSGVRDIPKEKRGEGQTTFFTKGGV